MKLSKNTSKSNTAKDSNNLCYHPLNKRVRTHRGYHCGICGKKFIN